MNPTLADLLSAATRAPSGDNTQPWRFEVDEARSRILVQTDDARDPSPMNAGQRMARIACGAAVENLLRAAQAQGWDARLLPFEPAAAAVIELRQGQGARAGIPAEIARRVTNRRPYDGNPVSARILEELERATPERDGVRTLWITAQERLSRLAALIGRADAALFGQSSIRHAFLKNVRFDLPPAAEADEGLPLNSLEASLIDRTALRLMRNLPDWAFRAGGFNKVFALHARKLIGSSSGLCVIAGPATAASSHAVPVPALHPQHLDLLIGQALQRAWLALAAHGLATQPMMSLPVLENVLEHGAPDLVHASNREVIGGLLQSLHSLLPELNSGRPGFILRFGFAPPPSGRTGRLPLQAVLARSGSEGMRSQAIGVDAASALGATAQGAPSPQPSPAGWEHGPTLVTEPCKGALTS